jgi:hypothetical protein
MVPDEMLDASRDWLGNPAKNLVAWWIPQAAIIASLFSPVPARTVIAVIALLWPGTACLLNARRCGRTHCRFIGPYYLAMILPVLASAWVSSRPEFTPSLPWLC